MAVTAEWVIHNKAICPGTWTILPADTTEEQLSEWQGRDVVLPLQLWLSLHARIESHTGRIGVWLKSDEKASDIVAGELNDINAIPLIALSFPVFSDGRNYSNARALRQNLGFSGDLLAFGDVLRDQAFYMTRCGINMLMPRADQNPDEMLLALQDFRDSYQATVEQPLPLFRRR